jgi:hypothetical protein
MTKTSAWFAGLNLATHHGMLRNAIRRDLDARLRQPQNELGRTIVDLATDTIAVVLVLDGVMKYLGPLSPEQATTYVEACRHRDGALRALGLPGDLYRQAAA